jgi:hypothetical protein
VLDGGSVSSYTEPENRDDARVSDFWLKMLKVFLSP